ncbi:GH39 family glycosyl hydrolase [Paenibacillus glycanilyticus]|uniref:GH39 family glycosyl hydrolase n=1 Tax=Paenibacillus glycanilyticus TaxID=126569 RepID=UPI000FD7F5C5|nr:hypothetical protein [Paenibacillus glycanilyticus]
MSLGKSILFKKAAALTLSAVLLTAVIAIPSNAFAASVSANVNWNVSTGKTAGNLSYGMNIYKAFEGSTVAGDSSYKTNVAYMNNGILRYHRADQMAESRSGYAGYSPGGWVNNPGAANYAWDYTKIDSIFSNTFSNSPIRMVDFANWPSYMDDGTGKLKTNMYDAYAAFCADLVDYLNNVKHYNIQYWEVFNELENGPSGPYSNNMGELAVIYNKVATALKLKDSSIKVGGPAFARADLTAQVDAFLAGSHAKLDFVSYHSYASGNTACGATPLTNQQLFDAADAGWVTTSMKTEIAKYTTRNIETFHDEYNISWCPPDNRMNNEIGMIFDSLAMISMAKAGATGTMAWNEADGYYGKLEGWSPYNKRASANLYNIFNSDMKGDIVASTVSDGSKLAVMAVKSGSWRKIAIVNRSETDQTVQLAISGASSNVTSSTSYTAKQVLSWGVNYASVTHGTLTGSSGYSIPANSVTVLVMDEGSLAVPNKVLNNSLESASDWGYYYGTRQASNARTGTYSAQVGNGAYVWQTITGLSPNTTYTLKGWGKKQSSGITSYMYVSNYGGAQINTPITGTSYGLYTITFTTGASTTSADIGIWQDSGTGFTWGDDFELN